MVSSGGGFGGGRSIGGVDDLLIFIVLIGVVALVVFWKSSD